ncbi:MAG: hypothetical protein K2X63_04320, partial [Burkholderiaceae bacterium]|nr:hypothetical protein [Burkholderiaceae bacterium]
AGDTSDSVLQAATNITPDMFATWADYAVNFYQTKNAIGEKSASAYRSASDAASSVAMIEEQIRQAEDAYKLNLSHYDSAEKLAKETLDKQIGYFDSITTIAQMQLQEALGTKLAVMALNDSMSNYAGAISILSNFTGRQLTSTFQDAPSLTVSATQKSNTDDVVDALTRMNAELRSEIQALKFEMKEVGKSSKKGADLIGGVVDGTLTFSTESA